MFGIKDKIKFNRYQKRWRSKNQHNNTWPLNHFDLNCVKVGNYTYGGLHIENYNKKSTLYIGSYCSIAGNVKFLLDADHPMNYISTYPFHVDILRDRLFETVSKGDITIDDDVWIGYGAIILSNVHIGQGAVIGAGAVVTKDVPSYAVVAGVPAKIIKYRFNKEIIELLNSIDYTSLTKKMIEDHIEDLYMDLNNEKIENVKKIIEWMPKK